jgi:DNA-binding transcriptional regulator YiaG
MGIAATLVRSWEDGTSQPDNRQLKALAGVLGCNPDLDPTKEDVFS